MNRKENIKILLVDDEPDILEILRYNFCASGYQVTAVTSAEEALTLDLSAFDLIILDLMLGGMSGERLTMLLKENPLTADIPLIMLTAKNAREDIIDGLRLGVDDYVSKPFSVQELLLRAQAVLRRSRRPASRGDAGEEKALSLDERGKSLRIEGKTLSLTRTEFGILQLLMEHPGRVFSREQLLDKAWPEGVVVTDRSVDVSITRLRKKLGPYAKWIVTRSGHGYAYTDEDIEV